MTPVHYLPSPELFDVRAILDEELRQLPEKYRVPLVLCYLEGRTNDEAAAQLGWTRGTVAGRLSRARELLRGRLARRGLALTSGGLAAILTEKTLQASLPAGLLPVTLKMALGCAAGELAPAPAQALAEGVLRSMFMSKLKLGSVVLFALVILGAGSGWFFRIAGAKPPAPDPQSPSAPEKGSKEPVRTEVKVDPAQAKEDRPALVASNGRFACDLFGRIRQAEGNIVFSPYSISTALAMTRAGARGITADEMDKVLHFDLSQERLHRAAGGLVRELNGAGDDTKRKYALSVSNALWGQKGYNFREEFLSLTRDRYDAGLVQLDFIHDREESRKTINTAVEKQTHDKIKELLKSGHITPATRLVLTNAIYFKSEWESKFSTSATKDQSFQLTADKKVNVPMMSQTSQFNYWEDESLQLLELLYVGKDLSMLLLLPRKVDGLGEVEKELTQEKLIGWTGKMKKASVTVSLPKFKVTGEFALAETLAKMGMETAFDCNRADFSGMTTSDRLWIQHVVHQAFVDVNEEGTEAAAATAVVIGLSMPPPGPVVKADHPFLFLIRDNRSGSLLFLGRVADPSK